MQLRLKVLSGPAEGQSFALRDGMTIGRQDANIPLSDPRVSSVHARIRQHDTRWSLQDNQSKNGIRDGEGNKVGALELTRGVRFSIGESRFEVLGEDVERRAPEAKVAAGPRPGAEKAADRAEAAGAGKPNKKHAVFWHEALAGFVTAQVGAFRDKIRPTALFEPALVFDFARGPQVNARWVLGYGPRRIGAASLDLPLWEPGIPPLCFEITPTAEGVLLTTSVPQLVRVNGRGVDRHVLNVGDTIEIRETLIEVDFTE